MTADTRPLMPELPEVETVKRGLAPTFEGALIAKVDQNRPDLRFPLPADFASRLTGRRIESIGRRAKYMLWHLDDGTVSLGHLGMSGRMIMIDRPNSLPGKHDHLVFELGNGLHVRFNDARRFGYFSLTDVAGLSSHPHLAGLGPEPLGTEFDAAYLRRRLAGKQASIKAALLDQRVVAGLGNIYVCEALYHAGIAPTRQAGHIGAAKLARLVDAIRTVLGDAIAAGVAQTGASVIIVDSGVDTGPVLAQQRVPVLPDDTQDTLHDRIKLVERDLLASVIIDIADGTCDLADHGLERRRAASDTEERQ